MMVDNTTGNFFQAETASQAASTERPKLFDTSNINWFPGHMATAVVKIQKKIRDSNLVREKKHTQPERNALVKNKFPCCCSCST